jgi:hypothetical protein
VAVGAIGRTPSDAFVLSRLPEADQRAILRQADDKEFERYVTHAQMKIRAQAREERRGDPVDVTMPAKSFPKPSPAASAPAPAPVPGPASPPSIPPPPPRGRSMADQLLQSAHWKDEGPARSAAPQHRWLFGPSRRRSSAFAQIRLGFKR